MLKKAFERMTFWLLKKNLKRNDFELQSFLSCSLAKGIKFNVEFSGHRDRGFHEDFVLMAKKEENIELDIFLPKFNILKIIGFLRFFVDSLLFTSNKIEEKYIYRNTTGYLSELLINQLRRRVNAGEIGDLFLSLDVDDIKTTIRNNDYQNTVEDIEIVREKIDNQKFLVVVFYNLYDRTPKNLKKVVNKTVQHILDTM